MSVCTVMLAGVLVTLALQCCRGTLVQNFGWGGGGGASKIRGGGLLLVCSALRRPLAEGTTGVGFMSQN
jgi:hypothetical protein